MLKITRTKFKVFLIRWLTNALRRLIATETQHIVCPACKMRGLKSTVREGATWKTAVGLPGFDDKGLLLPRHPPIVTVEYSCSNGHRFEQRR